MSGDFRSAVRVTRPTSAAVFMLAFLGVVAVVGYFLAQPIFRVFLANPYLNGLILFALMVGVGYAFWQVFRLNRCVDWIEAFIAERPGFDTITPPRLLASMAGMLRERESRRSLSATTVRAILDSIATRLDESREIVRYARDLLIFLGLLGTFWGLSIAVPAIVSTIRELGPTEGASTADVFGRLVVNLGDQMKGLETAFASSLLGLAGSLILGFLDLLAGHAQNRFYRELEEALAQITHISRGDAVGGGGGVSGAALERATEAIEVLIDRMDEAQARTIVGSDAMLSAAQQLAAVAEGHRTGETALMRIGDGQDALRLALVDATERNRGVIGGMDEATRERIENMDAHLMRLLEEVSAGRAESTEALRGDVQTLTRVIAAAARGELDEAAQGGAR